MLFCVNCGQQLTDRSKFCAECGAPVNGTNQSVQRKAFYDGEIHKCPNCGEELKSFEASCSSCKLELRGISAINSVRELTNKLQAIESTRENKKTSSFKKVFWRNIN